MRALMVVHCRALVVILICLLVVRVTVADGSDEGEIVSARRLRRFVDHLPDMPRVIGYRVMDGVAIPRSLTIGMFEKKWKFHRDLPPTRVFAYGTTRRSATVPGPTIEALQGVETRIRWENHLPRTHILPWDPTIPTASAPGVPAVVHLHGAIVHPASDGSAMAWFTAGFNSTGPAWSQEEYSYPNAQEPGNLWYHDHAMGLTRINLLAGLVGAYVVRSPRMESPLRLPSGQAFDRHLVVFDRSFLKDGSIYMNSTGNNPGIHPQWQPEYFGDVIVVNGKAWPVARVQRRKYRFRIINASNARFFRFFFSNGLRFTHVGSDSTYLRRPYSSLKFVLAPSEIADVVVDFAESELDEVILANDAPYPFPSGDPADESTNGKVMKFVIGKEKVRETSRVPAKLLQYPRADPRGAVRHRYIALYEYESSAGEPTHLLINGRRFSSPATETPQAGTSEVWDVINLTEDNHPVHIHLGLFVVLDQRELERVEELKGCMGRWNDAVRCDVEGHAVGERKRVPAYESGWKNVYKMKPGYRTRILVRFAMLKPDPDRGYLYPFDASAEPGYVYHCHILDHEDNEMMRPLKILY